MPSTNDSRPIIIVTGANSGVGFGICHRLISQLTNGHGEAVSNDFELNCDGLTLILACRNKQRAEAAQAKLYGIADQLVRQAQRSPKYDGRAATFRKNLRIDVGIVDLANIESVFRFADEITQGYPYVSHLICNAGVACFKGIIWTLAVRQLLTDWISAVTAPSFYIQSVGDLSQDRLGWVWQCNVFGHYVLFRALEHMITKQKATTGARVVWISSHEASSKLYDPKDWQLVKSENSYGCSKYQMNMMALHLDREAVRNRMQVDGNIQTVRHLIAYPGVAGTNIAAAILGTFTSLCMFVTLYIARLLGSINHPIDVFKAAVSGVHLSLVRDACLPDHFEGQTNLTESSGVGTAYTANTNRWGREYAGTVKFAQSQEEQEQTKVLLQHCDRLMKTFCDAEGRPSPSG